MSDWQRTDYVELEQTTPTMDLDGTGASYRQHLVATDDPAHNQRCWLIVADESDYTQVGKFKSTLYVEGQNPKLLYRASDRAVAADPNPPEQPDVTIRGALLREAEGLITGDRNKSYGSPTENFTNIADLWNIQFGHKLAEGEKFTPVDVAVAMIHVKQARLMAQPKRDNFTDIAGYAACAWECVEETREKASND